MLAIAATIAVATLYHNLLIVQLGSCPCVVTGRK